MLARLGPPQPAPGADVIVRTMGALALITLAVIHVVDLPGTLGPTPLVGIGYLGIIVAALGVGGVMIAQAKLRARERIAAERAARKRAEARRRILAGAQYNPQVLTGLSAAQIASQLSNPSSPVARAIDGSAQVIVAAIDQVLHDKTASQLATGGSGR